MTFEPGSSYYVLEPDEYNAMRDIMVDEGLSYDLANDFDYVDGKYYAKVGGGVDAAEAEFMADWGFYNILEYKKSTQSTHFY